MSSKFNDYIQRVNQELTQSNVHSDNIKDLLECRDIIEGHLEYLRNISVDYYEESRIEESRYKETRAEIILAADNPTKGMRIAESQDYELKKKFIEIESKYKKIRSFVESLEGKADTLKQKISYLKSEESNNKFLKHD